MSSTLPRPWSVHVVCLLMLLATGCAAPVPRPSQPVEADALSGATQEPDLPAAGRPAGPAADTEPGAAHTDADTAGATSVDQAPAAADGEPTTGPGDAEVPQPFVGLSGAPLPAGIDARTQELLEALSLRFKERPKVRFQLTETVERLDEHGRKVQATHLRSGTSARPDRLVMTVEGDVQRLGLWKSDGVITLLDRASNTWRSFPDDGTRGMLADLLAIDGVPLLAFRFFLEADPAAALLEDVVSGEYLGVHHVNETACDHIILSTPTHDRQLWIEAEGRRRAVKLIETFRDLPGHPQYELRLEISTTVEAVPASLFVFEPPEGAVQVTETAPPAASGGSADAEG